MRIRRPIVDPVSYRQTYVSHRDRRTVARPPYRVQRGTNIGSQGEGFMSENAMGRRQALRGAGIAAGGVAVAGLATATPATADSGGGLLGSWLCVRQDDGSPDKVRLVLSFAGGGVIVSHDISPAGPPFTGTWASQGKSFRLTMWTGAAGEEGPESVGPTIRVRAWGSVSHGKLTATYRFTVFAPLSETQVVASGTGKLSGHRISA
jgi:hypothetical protein